jgi:hypothetical protein
MLTGPVSHHKPINYRWVDLEFYTFFLMMYEEVSFTLLIGIFYTLASFHRTQELGKVFFRSVEALLNPLKPSGHYMYRTVVTICTASLTINNSTFCPHSVFTCFVCIWEQTAIFSLYSINWLVCINETGCVYCAVRAVCLNMTQVNFVLKDRD